MKIKTFYILSISFLYIILWGICFLDIEADRFTCIIGLSLTILSITFLEKELSIINTKQKFLLLTFPIIYLFVFIILNFSKDLKLIIFNPLNISLILMIISLFFRKQNKYLTIHLLLYSIIIIGYSYTFYPRFRNENPNSSNTTITEKSLNNFIIKDCYFYNEEGDKINISNSTNTKMIITWNEDCGPCKKAIKDLAPEIDKLNFDLILVYVPFKNSNYNPKNLDNFRLNSRIFLFEDRDFEIKKKLNISSVPYIQILKNSKTHYTTIGYKSSKRNEIIDALSL